MKYLAIVVSLASTLFLGTPAIVCAAPTPPPAPRVELSVRGATDLGGNPLSQVNERQDIYLILGLRNLDTGKPIGPSDLVIAHEKLFHFFAFDAALTNYRHEHPEPNTAQKGIWRVKIRFGQTGQYKLWSDITLAPSAAPAPAGPNVLSMTTLNVFGASAPNPPVRALDPLLKGRDDNSVIGLTGPNPIPAGAMTMFDIDFSRVDGTPPVITPYLGALAHFVITDITGTHLLHAHPMVMGKKLMLHVSFPVAGDYRLFAQFIDGGVLRTVELAARAVPGAFRR